MQRRRVVRHGTIAAALLASVVVPGAARAQAQAAPTPLADDPTLIALAVSLSCANAPDAVEPASAPAVPAAPANAGPELELVATVRAKALRFDEVPKVDVVFRGSGPRHTTWKTERVNLPVHPEAGVTYRDVAVRLTITSSVDELSDLLAQAKRMSRGIRVDPDEAPPPPAKAPAASAPPAR